MMPRDGPLSATIPDIPGGLEVVVGDIIYIIKPQEVVAEVYGTV